MSLRLPFLKIGVTNKKIHVVNDLLKACKEAMQMQKHSIWARILATILLEVLRLRTEANQKMARYSQGAALDSTEPLSHPDTFAPQISCNSMPTRSGPGLDGIHESSAYVRSTNFLQSRCRLIVKTHNLWITHLLLLEINVSKKNFLGQ
jgi:hypothetical protein